MRPHRRRARSLRGLLLAALLPAWGSSTQAEVGNFYFPPPGETLAEQDLRIPEEVGLDPAVVTDLAGSGTRWALWRHGHLVHVEGDFNLNQDTKSVRKLVLALLTGSALEQGRIPSVLQALSVWQTQLEGKDAEATWHHALTQSTGFDYPGCGDPTDYDPGEMWTYSDLNALHLSDALAKVYGKPGYTEGFEDVAAEAFFDAAGMQGWGLSVRADGIRFKLDLEDLGRLGLLLVADGVWNGARLIPEGFMVELESQQTQGMDVNYEGCNDGTYPALLGLTEEDFPTPPFGYMTWLNHGGLYFPAADPRWSFSSGDGGGYLLWNAANGVVFASFEVDAATSTESFPHLIEANLLGPNPLGPAPEPLPALSPLGTAALVALLACLAGVRAGRER